MYRYVRTFIRSIRRHPRCITSDQCVQQGLFSDERLVYPALTHDRTIPRCFGGAAVRWSKYLAREFPAGRVFVSRNARVHGPEGWVTVKNNRLAADLGWFSGHTFEIDRKKMMMNSFEHVPGRVFSIATNFADINYGHFVLDALPRFGMFLKAGYTHKDFDFLYTAKPLGRGAQNLLMQLGVPEEKILIAQPRVGIEPDELITTSYPGIRMNYLPWTIEYLRSLRPDLADIKPSRRLFIDRKSDLRHLANTEQLLPILDKHGFELINPAEVEDAPRIFAEAEIVVGAHSAGITDIAFCQAGSHMLELIPSDHQQPYYYTVADSGRLNYSYILGQSIGKRPMGATGPSKLDFAVDPDVFAHALDTMVAERKQTCHV